MLDKVPTRVNLCKMKMDINSTETIDHLLFGYLVVEVWRFIERWWQISLHMESMLKEALLSIIFVRCYTLAVAVYCVFGTSALLIIYLLVKTLSRIVCGKVVLLVVYSSLKENRVLEKETLERYLKAYLKITFRKGFGWQKWKAYLMPVRFSKKLFKVNWTLFQKTSQKIEPKTLATLKKKWVCFIFHNEMDGGR